MRLRRSILAVAAAAALAAVNTSHAALAPQITDAKGDSAVGAGNDILKVTFGTVKVKKVIKEVTITMEPAAAPVINPGSSYQIGADLGACGTLYVFSYWSLADAGTGHSWQNGCMPPDETGATQGSITPKVTIKGNKITWSVPYKSLPKQMQKLGFKFTGLKAYTAVTEPVVGYTPADFISASGANDWAECTKIFKMG